MTIAEPDAARAALIEEAEAAFRARDSGRASEIAWTVVPAVALAVLLVFTWRETRRATPLPDPHAGHTQVIEQ